MVKNPEGAGGCATNMLDQLVSTWTKLYPPVTIAGAPYCGRFAPSPSGPLHQGSLAAALASWLDARAHGGQWLLRIDNLDAPRTVAGADLAIMSALRAYGLVWDGAVVYQSARHAAYRTAFARLREQGLVYACGCTRREIADSVLRPGQPGQRGPETVYPGTCRDGVPPGRAPRAWRVRVGDAQVLFADRACGTIAHGLARGTGDFVLLRADGQWAYQLAVAVDDADAAVTHVVRGADLLDSTPRQIFLQQALGLATPVYLHVPVVTADDGEKLSKQNGAQPLPLDARGIAVTLERAARHLLG